MSVPDGRKEVRPFEVKGATEASGGHHRLDVARDLGNGGIAGRDGCCRIGVAVDVYRDVLGNW
jgi:hypothetical protein